MNRRPPEKVTKQGPGDSVGRIAAQSASSGVLPRGRGAPAAPPLPSSRPAAISRGVGR